MILLYRGQKTLFIHRPRSVHDCLYTVYGSHNTIHIFKNYFALVFSVFSFQFSVSAIISSIQTDSKSSRKLQDIIFIDTHLIACERYDKCP